MFPLPKSSLDLEKEQKRSPLSSDIDEARTRPVSNQLHEASTSSERTTSPVPRRSLVLDEKRLPCQGGFQTLSSRRLSLQDTTGRYVSVDSQPSPTSSDAAVIPSSSSRVQLTAVPLDVVKVLAAQRLRDVSNTADTDALSTATHDDATSSAGSMMFSVVEAPSIRSSASSPAQTARTACSLTPHSPSRRDTPYSPTFSASSSSSTLGLRYPLGSNLQLLVALGKRMQHPTHRRARTRKRGSTVDLSRGHGNTHGNCSPLVNDVSHVRGASTTTSSSSLVSPPLTSSSSMSSPPLTVPQLTSSSSLPSPPPSSPSPALTSPTQNATPAITGKNAASPREASTSAADAACSPVSAVAGRDAGSAPAVVRNGRSGCDSGGSASGSASASHGSTSSSASSSCFSPPITPSPGTLNTASTLSVSHGGSPVVVTDPVNGTASRTTGAAGGSDCSTRVCAPVGVSPVLGLGLSLVTHAASTQTTAVPIINASTSADATDAGVSNAACAQGESPVATPCPYALERAYGMCSPCADTPTPTPTTMLTLTPPTLALRSHLPKHTLKSHQSNGATEDPLPAQGGQMLSLPADGERSQAFVDLCADVASRAECCRPRASSLASEGMLSCCSYGSADHEHTQGHGDRASYTAAQRMSVTVPRAAATSSLTLTSSPALSIGLSQVDVAALHSLQPLPPRNGPRAQCSFHTHTHNHAHNHPHSTSDPHCQRHTHAHTDYSPFTTPAPHIALSRTRAGPSIHGGEGARDDIAAGRIGASADGGEDTEDAVQPRLDLHPQFTMASIAEHGSGDAAVDVVGCLAANPSLPSSPVFSSAHTASTTGLAGQDGNAVACSLHASSPPTPAYGHAPAPSLLPCTGLVHAASAPATAPATGPAATADLTSSAASASASTPAIVGAVDSATIPTISPAAAATTTAATATVTTAASTTDTATGSPNTTTPSAGSADLTISVFAPTATPPDHTPSLPSCLPHASHASHGPLHVHIPPSTPSTTPATTAAAVATIIAGMPRHPSSTSLSEHLHAHLTDGLVPSFSAHTPSLAPSQSQDHSTHEHALTLALAASTHGSSASIAGFSVLSDCSPLPLSHAPTCLEGGRAPARMHSHAFAHALAQEYARARDVYAASLHPNTTSTSTTLAPPPFFPASAPTLPALPAPTTPAAHDSPLLEAIGGDSPPLEAAAPRLGPGATAPAPSPASPTVPHVLASAIPTLSTGTSSEPTVVPATSPMTTTLPASVCATAAVEVPASSPASAAPSTGQVPLPALSSAHDSPHDATGARAPSGAAGVTSSLSAGIGAGMGTGAAVDTTAGRLGPGPRSPGDHSAASQLAMLFRPESPAPVPASAAESVPVLDALQPHGAVPYPAAAATATATAAAAPIGGVGTSTSGAPLMRGMCGTDASARVSSQSALARPYSHLAAMARLHGSTAPYDFLNSDGEASGGGEHDTELELGSEDELPQRARGRHGRSSVGAGAGTAQGGSAGVYNTVGPQTTLASSVRNILSSRKKAQGTHTPRPHTEVHGHMPFSPFAGLAEAKDAQETLAASGPFVWREWQGTTEEDRRGDVGADARAQPEATRVAGKMETIGGVEGTQSSPSGADLDDAARASAEQSPVEHVQRESVAHVEGVDGVVPNTAGEPVMGANVAVLAVAAPQTLSASPAHTLQGTQASSTFVSDVAPAAVPTSTSTSSTSTSVSASAPTAAAAPDVDVSHSVEDGGSDDTPQASKARANHVRFAERVEVCAGIATDTATALPPQVSEDQPYTTFAIVHAATGALATPPSASTDTGAAPSHIPAATATGWSPAVAVDGSAPPLAVTGLRAAPWMVAAAPALSERSERSLEEHAHMHMAVVVDAADGGHCPWPLQGRVLSITGSTTGYAESFRTAMPNGAHSQPQSPMQRAHSTPFHAPVSASAPMHVPSAVAVTAPVAGSVDTPTPTAAAAAAPAPVHSPCDDLPATTPATVVAEAAANPPVCSLHIDTHARPLPRESFSRSAVAPLSAPTTAGLAANATPASYAAVATMTSSDARTGSVPTQSGAGDSGGAAIGIGGTATHSAVAGAASGVGEGGDRMPHDDTHYTASGHYTASLHHPAVGHYTASTLGRQRSQDAGLPPLPPSVGSHSHSHSHTYGHGHGLGHCLNHELAPTRSRSNGSSNGAYSNNGSGAQGSAHHDAGITTDTAAASPAPGATRKADIALSPMASSSAAPAPHSVPYALPQAHGHGHAQPLPHVSVVASPSSRALAHTHIHGHSHASDALFRTPLPSPAPTSTPAPAHVPPPQQGSPRPIAAVMLPSPVASISSPDFASPLAAAPAPSEGPPTTARVVPLLSREPSPPPRSPLMHPPSERPSSSPHAYTHANSLSPRARRTRTRGHHTPASPSPSTPGGPTASPVVGALGAVGWLRTLVRTVVKEVFAEQRDMEAMSPHTARADATTPATAAEAVAAAGDRTPATTAGTSVATDTAMARADNTPSSLSCAAAGSTSTQQGGDTSFPTQSTDTATAPSPIPAASASTTTTASTVVTQPHTSSLGLPSPTPAATLALTEAPTPTLLSASTSSPAPATVATPTSAPAPAAAVAEAVAAAVAVTAAVAPSAPVPTATSASAPAAALATTTPVAAPSQTEAKIEAKVDVEARVETEPAKALLLPGAIPATATADAATTASISAKLPPLLHSPYSSGAFARPLIPSVTLPSLDAFTGRLRVLFSPILPPPSLLVASPTTRSSAAPAPPAAFPVRHRFSNRFTKATVHASLHVFAPPPPKAAAALIFSDPVATAPGSASMSMRKSLLAHVQAHKPHQEDSSCLWESSCGRLMVGIVADGHGGANGQLCSRTAVRSMQEWLCELDNAVASRPEFTHADPLANGSVNGMGMGVGADGTVGEYAWRARQRKHAPSTTAPATWAECVAAVKTSLFPHSADPNSSRGFACLSAPGAECWHSWSPEQWVSEFKQLFDETQRNILYTLARAQDPTDTTVDVQAQPHVTARRLDLQRTRAARARDTARVQAQVVGRELALLVSGLTAAGLPATCLSELDASVIIPAMPPAPVQPMRHAATAPDRYVDSANVVRTNDHKAIHGGTTATVVVEVRPRHRNQSEHICLLACQEALARATELALANPQSPAVAVALEEMFSRFHPSLALIAPAHMTVLTRVLDQLRAALDKGSLVGAAREAIENVLATFRRPQLLPRVEVLVELLGSADLALPGPVFCMLMQLRVLATSPVVLAAAHVPSPLPPLNAHTQPYLMHLLRPLDSAAEPSEGCPLPRASSRAGDKDTPDGAVTACECAHALEETLVWGFNVGDSSALLINHGTDVRTAADVRSAPAPAPETEASKIEFRSRQPVLGSCDDYADDALALVASQRAVTAWARAGEQRMKRVVDDTAAEQQPQLLELVDVLASTLSTRTPLPLRPLPISSQFGKPRATFLTEDHGPESTREYQRLQTLRRTQPDRYPMVLEAIFDKRNTPHAQCPRVFDANGARREDILSNPREHGLSMTNVRHEPPMYLITPAEAVDSTSIAMSRSLGDFHAQQYGLTHQPAWTLIRVPRRVPFGIWMGSDGVWDCWNYGVFASMTLHYTNPFIRKSSVSLRGNLVVQREHVRSIERRLFPPNAATDMLRGSSAPPPSPLATPALAPMRSNASSASSATSLASGTNVESKSGSPAAPSAPQLRRWLPPGVESQVATGSLVDWEGVDVAHPIYLSPGGNTAGPLTFHTPSEQELDECAGLGTVASWDRLLTIAENIYKLTLRVAVTRFGIKGHDDSTFLAWFRRADGQGETPVESDDEGDM